MSTDQPPITTPKIGILDSGVGGLSVLLEIKKVLTHIDIDYIADSSWCPYGNKSPQQIQQRVFSLAEHLISNGATIIVVACNSATIHAIEAARDKFSIPFIGMEPAVKPAAATTISGVIGVLATEASIAGEKFHHLLNTHAPPSKLKVITQPCPKFVTLVEQGILSGEAVANAITEYTKTMLEAGADTLVLGCTHYPFLRPAINDVLPTGIKLICTGEAVAKRTKSLLSQNAPNTSTVSDGNSHINIFTTGDLPLLRTIFPTLCPTLTANLSQLTVS